jgi:sporulation protein YlmC with PRC-barrel domain
VNYERPLSSIEQELQAQADAQRDDTLHSFREVNGYKVEASDGRMGDIEDMIIDPETWKLRYVVVDTSKILPGKDVLVPPEDVKSILFNGAEVQLDMTKAQLNAQPEFTTVEELEQRDPGGPVKVEKGR